MVSFAISTVVALGLTVVLFRNICPEQSPLTESSL
jgi:hypothetical protein